MKKKHVYLAHNLYRGDVVTTSRRDALNVCMGVRSCEYVCVVRLCVCVCLCPCVSACVYVFKWFYLSLRTFEWMYMFACVWLLVYACVCIVCACMCLRASNSISSVGKDWLATFNTSKTKLVTFLHRRVDPEFYLYRHDEQSLDNKRNSYLLKIWIGIYIYDLSLKMTKNGRLFVRT